jgi:type IV pilus assembly protein PilX
MKRRFSVQTGLVLPLVLIFLVIMMLLGTAVIRNVSLEEKMAGNLRNRNLAFQAAEHALRHCETSVLAHRTQADDIVIQPQGPMQASPNAGKHYWEVEENWTGPAPLAATVPRSATEVAANATEIFQQRPQCMVEHIVDPPLPSDTEVTQSEGGNIKTQYRITARGVGLDANTVVKLQSYLIIR